MRNAFCKVLTAASAAVLLSSLAAAPEALAAEKKAMSNIEKGKKLTFNRKKGNCLACHAIAGGKLPGNVGPPLLAMKARYPNKADLRATIWDRTKANPNTVMPPFGKHKILSDKDIDLITDFIHTL
ncbi:MAG: sulfur oxidation c-type cytochrome SoxX [Gammaproteobacteria bacterium]|nr:MAG: sulfur oxidation c-type cytochrome SoxX [Gammaproteobacteria bacterium]